MKNNTVAEAVIFRLFHIRADGDDAKFKAVANFLVNFVKKMPFETL